MDGNKDDALKCISLAIKAKENGHKEKAIKFLMKAERLYPTRKAKELLEELEEHQDARNDDIDGEGTNENKNNTNPDDEDATGNTRHRHAHKHKDAAHKTSESTGKVDAGYTQDQIDSVKRIKKCKDYYEILGVTKEATDNDLKKSYKKLALQMHPDKNKAPGATEAFKAIGNAFSVLSNKEKRRQYDLYGPEMEQPSHRTQRYDYTHGGFEGDITPEELFNMFFGGGFPSTNVYHRRHGHTHTYQREAGNEGTGTLLLQLSPILILVVLSLLSSFFVSDPMYSLERSSKYVMERHTQRLNVPYYVKQDFHIDYKGDLRRIERQVEDDFITNLRSNCFRERSVKENMMWRARSYGDGKLYNQAMNMNTPSCDRLQHIYS